MGLVGWIACPFVWKRLVKKVRGCFWVLWWWVKTLHYDTLAGQDFGVAKWQIGVMGNGGCHGSTCFAMLYGGSPLL